jgi:tetratricopeptide (TPR) repeat protein
MTFDALRFHRTQALQTQIRIVIMPLPEGSILLLIVWGFAVFLLWNLYHFSRAFRQTTFVILAGLATAALAGGIMYWRSHHNQPLPDGRTGVLIFPFVEKTGNGSAGMISAGGLAIADLIGERLQQATPTPFYRIPPAALLGAANHDSIIYIDYVLRFAKTAGLPVIGFGVYQETPSLAANHRASLSADIRLFDFRQNPLRETRLQLPEQISNRRELADAAAQSILKIYGKQNDKALAAEWQFQTDTDLLQRYYSAKLALALNQTESAVQQAQALWQADTSRAPLTGLYAQALRAQLRLQNATQREWEKSLPIFQRAAARDSLRSDSARLLGEVYIRLKKWNEAERALLLARRREPTDSEIYLLLAQLHHSRFRPLGFENELELYQYARALNPINLQAGLAEADYLWRENREKQAIEILEHWLKLNPNHLEALMSLGRIYIANGNQAKIFEIYGRILKLAPDNAGAYYNLGIVYYHAQDDDNAIKFFERAIQLDNHAEAQLYLASIYQRRGELERAMHYLRERIRLSRGDDDPYAAEARRQLYSILLGRGEIPPHLQPDSLK